MLEGRTGRRGGMGLVGARRTDTPDGRTVDTKERKPFGFLDAASSFGFALSWRRVAAGADQRAKERTNASHPTYTRGRHLQVLLSTVCAFPTFLVKHLFGPRVPDENHGKEEYCAAPPWSLDALLSFVHLSLWISCPLSCLPLRSASILQSPSVTETLHQTRERRKTCSTFTGKRFYVASPNVRIFPSTASIWPRFFTQLACYKTLSSF